MPSPPAKVAPPTVALERETPTHESSAVVLARIDGSRRAFIADEDDRAIVEVDLETNAVHSTPIRERPRDLLVFADGSLAATLPDANAIVRWRREKTGELREVARIDMPAEPVAMGLSDDESHLYVSTGASHRLVAVETASFSRGAEWDLRREPRAVLASGAKVFVAHASDSALSVITEGSPEVARTELGNRADVDSDGGGTRKRLARHAHAVVRMGEGQVVIPTAQVLPNPSADGPGMFKPVALAVGLEREDGLKSPGEGLSGYGRGDGSDGPPVFMDLVSVDIASGARRAPKFGFIGVTGTDCLLPRAAVAVGDRVAVACLGSGRIDMNRPGNGTSRREVTSKVPSGPTGLAVNREGTDILVWSTFARTVVHVDLAKAVPGPKAHALPSTIAKAVPGPKAHALPSTIAASEPIVLPRVLEREADWLHGRELFTTNGDPRISADGRACASCHVDGRDDGIAWETPMGLRRTRTLGGQLDHGPYGWRGEHPTLESHVTVTLKQLGGKGLPEDDFAALLTYVKSIPRPPAGKAKEERGRQLFAAADCGSCHNTDAGDRSVHDVGTGGTFMTPTLAGIGARRTLMHDGRYASLDDLLVGAKAMGSASKLPPEDRSALVRYLETL